MVTNNSNLFICFNRSIFKNRHQKYHTLVSLVKITYSRVSLSVLLLLRSRNDASDTVKSPSSVHHFINQSHDKHDGYSSYNSSSFQLSATLNGLIQETSGEAQ